MSEKGLLNAIIDAPDDDVPRLVFADWLEEHGDDDRSAFIRLQCRRASLDPDDPEIETLNRADFAMRRRHEKAWKQQTLPSRLRSARCTFRRGFLAEVQTTARQFILGVAALKKRTPLEGAELPDAHEHAEALADGPHLDGLSVLRLRGQYSGYHNRGAGVAAAQVGRWSRAGRLDALREVEMRDCPVKADGARELAGLALPRLRTLCLNDCGLLDAASLQALAGATFAAQLETLDLRSNWFRAQGETLGAWPAGQLRHLQLSNTGLDAAGLAAVANAAFAPGLRTLHLSSTMPPEGFAAAMRANRFGDLRRLNLDCMKIGGAGVRGLAEAAGLDELRTLVLSNGELGDADVETLAGGRCFPNLLTLNLWANHLGDLAAGAVARSTRFPALRSLTLAHNAITDAGARLLAESPLADRLSYLGLWQTRLSEDGKRMLRERFGERVELG